MWMGNGERADFYTSLYQGRGKVGTEPELENVSDSQLFETHPATMLPATYTQMKRSK